MISALVSSIAHRCGGSLELPGKIRDVFIALHVMDECTDMQGPLLKFDKDK